MKDLSISILIYSLLMTMLTVFIKGIQERYDQYLQENDYPCQKYTNKIFSWRVYIRNTSMLLVWDCSGIQLVSGRCDNDWIQKFQCTNRCIQNSGTWLVYCKKAMKNSIPIFAVYQQCYNYCSSNDVAASSVLLISQCYYRCCNTNNMMLFMIVVPSYW